MSKKFEVGLSDRISGKRGEAVTVVADFMDSDEFGFLRLGVDDGAEEDGPVVAVFPADNWTFVRVVE